MDEQELIKKEKELDKIEKEIFDHVKDKIKDVYSKEAQGIIETEVRNRNYLSEDWQILNAVDRIKEMFKIADIKVYKPKKLKPAGILLLIFIMIVSFVGMMASISINNPMLRGGLVMLSFSCFVYPIKRWWDSFTSKG